MTAEIINFGCGDQVRGTPADVYLEAVAAAYRSRDRVKEDIEKHIEARDLHNKAVAWEAAAESQNLPQCQIEQARERTAKACSEMHYRARMLIVCSPTDTRGLVDLLLYLEQNWTVMPPGFDHKSTAFNLLRSVRLSLRGVHKHEREGKS